MTIRGQRKSTESYGWTDFVSTRGVSSETGNSSSVLGMVLDIAALVPSFQKCGQLRQMTGVHEEPKRKCVSRESERGERAWARKSMQAS